MPWPSSADDPALKLIRDEEIRQNSTIQLIASENFASPATMAATGSVLTNKYSEGYPGKRYYGGNMVVDQLEDLARQRVCEIFGADHANVLAPPARLRTWGCTKRCSTRATRSWD